MVSLADVERAQREWGDGIVDISKAYFDGSDYVSVATEYVSRLYGYQLGPVLFKPTLATLNQFRTTFDMALSYFIASNKACPEDKGFAIKDWAKVRFENSNVIIDENRALAMGNYFFTDSQGSELKVEYTFGYIKDEDQNLRIQLHHSSLPANVE